MRRIRWRLARLLVGSFVTLPSKDGVWIVTQFADGRGHAVIEAESFRLRMSTKLNGYDIPGPAFTGFRPAETTGRFVGTVRR